MKLKINWGRWILNGPNAILYEYFWIQKCWQIRDWIFHNFFFLQKAKYIKLPTISEMLKNFEDKNFKQPRWLVLLLDSYRLTEVKRWRRAKFVTLSLKSGVGHVNEEVGSIDVFPRMIGVAARPEFPTRLTPPNRRREEAEIMFWLNTDSLSVAVPITYVSASLAWLAAVNYLRDNMHETRRRAARAERHLTRLVQ